MNRTILLFITYPQPIIINIYILLPKYRLEDIQKALIKGGTIITGEALKQFDTDGSPITLGNFPAPNKINTIAKIKTICQIPILIKIPPFNKFDISSNILCIYFIYLIGNTKAHSLLNNNLLLDNTLSNILENIKNFIFLLLLLSIIIISVKRPKY